MKRTLKTLICTALCCAAWSAFAGGPPNASQTAQSAMVDLQTDNSAYQIEGTITWTYHRDDCAVNSYTNAWNGVAPTISCTGGGQNGCQTAPASTAPGPDDNKLSQHAQSERCTFFCGGTLSSDSYTQQDTVNVNAPAPQAERGNWKFTYTYNVAPKGTEEFPSMVAAHTCWTSEETGGTVNVLFDGFVSSESFLKQSNGRTKYSFTLLDSLGASRVVNASAQLQKSDGLGGWVNVGSSVLLGPASDGTLPVTATTADYKYFGNAGVFGNSAVYSFLHAPSPGGLPATDVSSILLQDSFANNDNDLTAGGVHQANFDSSFPGITQGGDYRVVLSGTIKGNAGSADQQFSVTSSQIVIGGCACN